MELRSALLAGLALLPAAAPLAAQTITLPPSTVLTRRIDATRNTVQAAVNGVGGACLNPNLAALYGPLPANQPDWVFTYAQTCGMQNESLTRVGSQAYARVFFRTNTKRLRASADAAGGGHNFEISGALVPPASLDAFVAFCASYDGQRDIAFAGTPNGQIVGPTANLRATLLANRVGPAALPRYRVTGAIMTAAGIQMVNVTTPIGGQSFVTSMPAPPLRWRLGACRFTVPEATHVGAPVKSTTVDFKALYVAQYR